MRAIAIRALAPMRPLQAADQWLGSSTRAGFALDHGRPASERHQADVGGPLARRAESLSEAREDAPDRSRRDTDPSAAHAVLEDRRGAAAPRCSGWNVSLPHASQ